MDFLTFFWLVSFIVPHVILSEEVESSGWKDLNIIVHRNGEPDPCGIALLSNDSIDGASKLDNKFQTESFLTEVIADTMLDKSSCTSPDNYLNIEGIRGFCDMGKEHTPILFDYNKLVRVKGGTLPCRWYTREGLRITSMEQLRQVISKVKTTTCANPQECDNPNSEFHLYAVPAGRMFMFAPAFVGEKFDLSHMSQTPDPENPVVMSVLSINPRVFDLINVFTKEEADSLVNRALSETSPANRMKRSTTGTIQNSVFSKRTSENAFDTHSETSLKVKKRIFEAIGFDEYLTGHDDGLQVLRYNESTAYVQHMDYLTGTDEELYDYDSSKKGGNRFATVLLYMTDLPENGGGETVFSEADSMIASEYEKSTHDIINELRDSGDFHSAGIKPGSWEEEMVATCRSKLSVKPSRGRAVLFYSQHPNGEADKNSKHGGCPVLKGSKWAANLWIWNAPRQDYEGAPLREDLIAKGYKPVKKEGPQQLKAVFKNSMSDPSTRNAELYFEAMLWGDLGFSANPIHVNTYEGHRWNVRVDGKIIKEFVIGGGAVQVFEI